MSTVVCTCCSLECYGAFAYVPAEDAVVLGGHRSVMVVDWTRVDELLASGLTGATLVGPGPVDSTVCYGTECWAYIVGWLKLRSDLPCFEMFEDAVCSYCSSELTYVVPKV